MSKCNEVLAAGVPASDLSIAGLALNRRINSVPGERPSDAARSVVAEYQRNPVAAVELWTATVGTQFGPLADQ